MFCFLQDHGVFHFLVVRFKHPKHHFPGSIGIVGWQGPRVHVAIKFRKGFVVRQVTKTVHGQVGGLWQWLCGGAVDGRMSARNLNQ